MMNVSINPYQQSVTIDGVEVVKKFIEFPNALSHQATITCEYDRDSHTITNVQNVHRYVSHYIEKQYYYENLSVFVEWFYLEQQAQLDAIATTEAMIEAASNAAVEASTQAAAAKEEATQAKQLIQNTQQAVDNAISKLTAAGSTLPIKADGTDVTRTLGERFADSINVKDYGATDDGSTDNVELFRTLQALNKPIFVPDGRYVITEDIELSNFYGDGTIVLKTVTVDEVTGNETETFTDIKLTSIIHKADEIKDGKPVIRTINGLTADAQGNFNLNIIVQTVSTSETVVFELPEGEWLCSIMSNNPDVVRTFTQTGNSYINVTEGTADVYWYTLLAFPVQVV